jgi:hypothetical protein
MATTTTTTTMQKTQKICKEKKSGAQNEEMAPLGTYLFFNVIHFYKATLQGPLPFPVSPLFSSPFCFFFFFFVTPISSSSSLCFRHKILSDSNPSQFNRGATGGISSNLIIRRLSASRSKA